MRWGASLSPPFPLRAGLCPPNSEISFLHRKFQLCQAHGKHGKKHVLNSHDVRECGLSGVGRKVCLGGEEDSQALPLLRAVNDAAVPQAWPEWSLSGHQDGPLSPLPHHQTTGAGAGAGVVTLRAPGWPGVPTSLSSDHRGWGWSGHSQGTRMARCPHFPTIRPPGLGLEWSLSGHQDGPLSPLPYHQTTGAGAGVPLPAGYEQCGCAPGLAGVVTLRSPGWPGVPTSLPSDPRGWGWSGHSQVTRMAWCPHFPTIRPPGLGLECRFLQGCRLGPVLWGLTTMAEALLFLGASCEPLSSCEQVTLVTRAGRKLCSAVQNNEGLL
ncbi:uncharacterized protein [Saccopteryx bilineata]|uniref:uncharacterized protein isoform X2 n=1 Tax=Saccopteryx bilineata TaxID=59482 RepID=UPI00338E6C25